MTLSIFKLHPLYAIIDLRGPFFRHSDCANTTLWLILSCLGALLQKARPFLNKINNGYQNGQALSKSLQQIVLLKRLASDQNSTETWL